MDEQAGETVYDTQQPEDGRVMSERVQSLAGTVYSEFERMIKRYDEDVVKELMPLVVNVLETLDLAYSDKQENEVELELLRDDNEQLLTQYEREKQLRKAAEQKYLEGEDVHEEEKKKMDSQVESLESIVRMLELKSKNAQDHINRLEDKEAEMKKEYNKLHERYTELFRTHMDYMERTKIMMGADPRLMEMGASPGAKRGEFRLPNLRPTGMGLYETAETPVKVDITPTDFDIVSPGARSQDSSTSLKQELRGARQVSKETAEKAQLTDRIVMEDSCAGTSDDGTMGNMVTSPETEEFDESLGGPLKSTPTGNQKGNESSIFDELTSTGSDLIGEMDDGVDITGMSKEVENLILENTELLATKNALNIVKDDLIAKVDELSSEQEILREEITSLQTLKTKLKERVSELEEELKKAREELSKKGTSQENGEEDDVPMAQRKRFTRVEMARVLMERNQYKERLMELQEAVRWTEMIRASREHPDLVQKQKSKSSIWNFFSNLFSSTNKPEKRNRNATTATVRYSAPTTQVRPVGDPNKKQREKYNLGEKARAYDFMQDDLLTEKARRDRERERREQYKQVRAHVKKDDGRMQAYGWSLPAKYQPPMLKSEASHKSQVPVPVPVYCRPLLEKDSQMKIWCACGVNLSGGKTKDGGAIVGASVFYSVPPPGDNNKKLAEDDVEKLDQELQDREKLMKDLEREQQGMSSMVWICTTANNSSCVSVIDANQPGQILATFHVTSSHVLCIASVPGAMESDYQQDEDILKAEPETDNGQDSRRSASPAPGNEAPEHKNIGGITFVQCATGGCTSPRGSPQLAQDLSREAQAELAALGQLPDEGPQETQDVETKEERDPKEKEKDELEVSAKVTRATGSPARSGATSPAPGQTDERRSQPQTEVVKDGLSPGTEDVVLKENEERMSSVQPTVWMGTQSGSLYVHSAVSQWKRCLHSVKLKDSVLSIVHTRGRVLAALADGTVAVFHRASDGQWDLKNYHLVDLGRPHHSIRCMSVVGNQYVWCGYRNKVHVLDPRTLKLQRSFDAHPRRESQVRQLAWVGDGVWISIRLDSTLRLYHAYTYQHLQDVDIEPYVSKMLGTGKLGFSFVRITALLASVNRLWIGTGNGVIISVPLSESNRQAVTTVTQGGRPSPGGVVRVYSDTNDSVTPGSYIPYCSMAQAQLSFHGHKDAVKFFCSVPGKPAKGLSGVKEADINKDDNKIQSETGATEKNMLVISGGEGYIDFRVGDGDDEETHAGIQEEKNLLGKGDRSHLIVWQVFTNK